MNSTRQNKGSGSIRIMGLFILFIGLIVSFFSLSSCLKTNCILGGKATLFYLILGAILLLIGASLSFKDF